MLSNLKVIIVLLLTVLFYWACKQNNPNPQKTVLYIAVIGDAVPAQNLTGTPPTYSRSRAYGPSMWAGINAAYQNSRRISDIKEKIQLKRFDDVGVESDALKLAEEISNDPSIIAVIGHASSQTTKIAAPKYASVSIPVIMPIASSPLVFYPTNSEYSNIDKNSQKPLTNLFRMPPNDIYGQTPAIIYFVDRHFENKNKPQIAIIQDKSPDTPIYTTPLFNEVNKYLNRGSSLVITRDYDFSKDTKAMTDNLKSQNLQLIIFIGYGTQAQSLMAALRETYKDVPFEYRPVILLSDGCKIPDLNPSGFEVYLSFPIAPIPSNQNNLEIKLSGTNTANTNGIKIPVNKSPTNTSNLNLIKPNNNINTNLNTNTSSIQDDIEFLKQSMLIDGLYQEAYQMYGYDSMLLLGETISECEKESYISRICILNKLREKANFSGVYQQYKFSNGENSLNSYYIYNTFCKQDSKSTSSIALKDEELTKKNNEQYLPVCTPEYKLHLTISPSDIVNIINTKDSVKN